MKKVSVAVNMSDIGKEADTQSYLAIYFPMANDIRPGRKNAIVISPEGKFVATSHDNGVKVWSLSEERPVKIKETFGNMYQGLAVSDHGYLATGHGKLSVVVDQINDNLIQTITDIAC